MIKVLFKRIDGTDNSVLVLISELRCRFYLTYYFKVFNYLTLFEPKDLFLIYSPVASLRSDSLYLQQPVKASNQLLHTMFYRIVEAWYALYLSPGGRRLLCRHIKRGLRNVDLSVF
jgi:hypothetical protein